MATNNSSQTPNYLLDDDLAFAFGHLHLNPSSSSPSSANSNPYGPFSPLAPTPPPARMQPIGRSNPSASSSIAAVNSPESFLLPMPSDLLQERSRLSGLRGFDYVNASGSLASYLPSTSRKFFRESSLVDSSGSAAFGSALRERSNLCCLNNSFNNDIDYNNLRSIDLAQRAVALGYFYPPELSNNSPQRGATTYQMLQHGGSSHRGTTSASHGEGNPTPERMAALLKEKVRQLVLQGGMSVALATSESKSKLLCSLLDEGDVDIASRIIHGILPSLDQVMEDGSGYRLFEKLLHVCGYEELHEIVLAVTRDPSRLHSLAKKSFGVSSIKKLIDAVKECNGLIIRLTTALSYRILDLMIHGTASSLVDYCFNRLTYEQNMFLFIAAVKYCNDLATAVDKGCFSLELCIKFSRGIQREQILMEVVKNTTKFSEDTCGNYVIQSVVALEEPEYTRMICEQVARNIETFSMHKFASYVVQKCLQSLSGLILLQRLVELEDEEFNMIIRDQYGNYVIQTALDDKYCYTSQHRTYQDLLISRTEKLPQTLGTDRHARNVLKICHKTDSKRQSSSKNRGNLK